MSLQDTLTNPSVSFTKSEMKIVQVMLENYPISVLAPANVVAQRAGVSDPTVVRFAMKLGFTGYPALQRTVLSELEDATFSPLKLLELRSQTQGRKSDVYVDYIASMSAALEQLERGYVEQSFAQAADLLIDRKKRILCIGGRFTQFLAAILRAHLVQLRPNTVHVNGSASDYVDHLVDVSKKDVLVVYDYRRYQREVIDFARDAYGRGADVILFTDTWRSPIAEFASFCFTAPVETISPFDTMTPGLAQMEALIAAVTMKVADRARPRIVDIEELRQSRTITI